MAPGPSWQVQSASVTIGSVPWSSQKIELTVHSNTWSTFLKTWDQMKTTSFSILSLTGRAKKWRITFKISEIQQSVEEAVHWFMPHDMNPALTHLMNWLHKYSTELHKRLQKTSLDREISQSINNLLLPNWWSWWILIERSFQSPI